MWWLYLLFVSNWKWMVGRVRGHRILRICYTIRSVQMSMDGTWNGMSSDTPDHSYVHLPFHSWTLNMDPLHAICRVYLLSGGIHFILPFACHQIDRLLELAHFRTFAFSNWTFGYTMSSADVIVVARGSAEQEMAQHCEDNISPTVARQNWHRFEFRIFNFEAQTCYPGTRYKSTGRRKI